MTKMVHLIMRGHVILCVLASVLVAGQDGIESADILQTSGISSCLGEKQSDGVIKGDIVYPGNSTYGVKRRTTSLLFSAWPVGIVYATSEEDVVEAVKCANEYRTRVTPRSGGHGNAGQAVMSGGLTIDLSRMKNVSLSEDMSLVTVGSGSTAGNAVYWTYKYSNGTRSLPVGQKPSVGMSGLTLGGGFGFSTRTSGLLCDRLESLRMVLLDGSVLDVSSNENEDLFWASCGGGGGNFGIVTEFVFRPAVLSPVYTEFVYLLPFVPSYVGPIIEYYQKWSLRLDNRATANLEMNSINDVELQASLANGIAPWLEDTALAIFNGTYQFRVPVPDDVVDEWRKSRRITYLSIVGIFEGNRSEFESALTESGLTNSTPIVADRFNLKEGTLLDAILNLSGWNTTTPESLLDLFEWEHSYYKYKSFFLEEELALEAVDLILNSTYIGDGSSMIFEFQSLGGENSAFSSVEPTETAFAHRNARHCLMLKSSATTLQNGTQALGDMMTLWTELLPMVKGQAAYVNHMDTDIWDYQRAYYGLTGYSSSENAFSNINRLASISGQTNPSGSLASAQPCCSSIQADNLEESKASSDSHNTYHIFHGSWYLFALSLLLSCWLFQA